MLLGRPHPPLPGLLLLLVWGSGVTTETREAGIFALWPFVPTVPAPPCRPRPPSRALCAWDPRSPSCGGRRRGRSLRKSAQRPPSWAWAPRRALGYLFHRQPGTSRLGGLSGLLGPQQIKDNEDEGPKPTLDAAVGLDVPANPRPNCTSVLPSFTARPHPHTRGPEEGVSAASARLRRLSAPGM